MLNQEDAIRQKVNDFFENLTDEQLARLNKNVDSGIATNRPLSVGVTEHIGIVHGAEYVITKDKHQAQRDLLDKNYEGDSFTRSIDDDGNVVVTINVPN